MIAQTIDFNAIAAGLLPQAESICKTYLPDGKREGHEWIARNPRRADRNPGSFKVNLQTGIWCDFATGDKGGDLISLVAYVNGCAQGEAARDLELRYMAEVAPELQANLKRPEWVPIVPVPEDAPAPSLKHFKYGECSASWIYRDADGRMVAIVCRFESSEGKRIAPRTYCRNAGTGKCEWRWQGLSAPRPIYNLDKLATNPEARVVLCEGEKACDAMMKISPEVVAVTSMHGCLSPHLTDWSPLAGRTVDIWPDADEPGRAYADRVARLIHSAGAEQIRIFNVDRFPTDIFGLPEGWDADDALKEGWTGKMLQELVNNVPDFLIEPDFSSNVEDAATSSKSGVTGVTCNRKLESVTGSQSRDSQAVIPYDIKGVTTPCGVGYFDCRDDGVWFVVLPVNGGDDAEDGDDKPQAKRKRAREIFVCSKLEIESCTSGADGRSEDWGRLLVFKDPVGHIHRWIMPMSLLGGDGSELRRELLRLGLIIGHTKQARDLLPIYIQTTTPKRQARCVEGSGWYKQHFVLSDGTVIGDADELIYLSPEKSISSGVAVQGTAGDWRDTVAKYCSGNSRLLFAVSAAFASPLLRLVSLEGGGLHFEGGSSIGKSTALYTAASVYGSPAYVKTWRATSNGLEGTAVAHNDLMLILDEIHEVDPNEAGGTAYMLFNGRGKQRANRVGGGRPVAMWRVMVLSSGEKGLGEHMQSAGKKSTAGQEIRLLDLPADAGKGFGLFDTVHGFANGDSFSREITRLASGNYGAVGREYLQRLCDDYAQLPEVFNNFLTDFLGEHVAEGASGQVRRAAQRFAIVAFGGELATKYGLTGWQSGAATEAAARLFSEWQESRGGIGELEKAQLISQVRLFFEQHSESRFVPITDADRPITNRAGFRKNETDGSVSYFVLPEVFRTELVKGFNPRRAAKHLAEAGILQTAGGKHSQVIKVGGASMRVYKFSSELFGGVAGDDNA